MKLSKKLLILPPVAVGMLIIILVVSFKSGPQRQDIGERETPAGFINVATMEFQPRAIGYGPVQPDRVWRAIAQVGGAVVELNPKLEAGVMMPADSLIARIDPTEYELAVAQQNSQVRNAEATLAQLELEATNLKRTLELEQKNLALSEADLKRNIKLMESNNVSETVLERIERDAVGQRLRVQSIQNNLDLIPARRDQLRTQKDLAESRLADSRRRLALTEIRTPYDCRIEAKNVIEGEVVAPGTVLIVADSIDRAEIEARFSIDQLAPLLPEGVEPLHEFGIESGEVFASLGLQAKVRLNTSHLTPKWEARVSRASASLDPKTRTNGVIVTVDEPYRKAVTGVRPPLIKGMFCEVELSGEKRQRMLIPRNALHGNQVYTRDAENRLRFTEVTIGGQQGNIAWITAGLSEGDRLVVTDLVPAIEGMLLEPRMDDQLQQRLIDEAAGGAQ